MGYYVNNEYKPFEGYNEEEHGVPDLQTLDLSKVCRQIVSDKPRVTRFAINWAGDIKLNTEMEEDRKEEEEMEVDENVASNQSIFSTPSKLETTSSQNIVSPDTFHNQRPMVTM